MPTTAKRHTILGNLDDAKHFILGGHAFFTVENGQGDHFTYRCRIWSPSEDEDAPKYHMIAVLNGPDNTRSYVNIGRIDAASGEIRQTRSAKVGSDALSFKVLAWTLRQIWQRRAFPQGYDVLHEGKCGRCGRKLTVPASIQRGLGPTCATRID